MEDQKIVPTTTGVDSMPDNQPSAPAGKTEEAPADSPVTEASFPAKLEQGSNESPDINKPSRRKSLIRTGLIAAIVLVLCVTNIGSYLYGYHRSNEKTNAAVSSAEMADTNLQVPKGATIIEQCDPGKGTQYVLPSDIPNGPVYNVYKGKVVGVEYMIGKDELASDKSFYNLPLFGKKYNHIDIGNESQGHAGYPEPHYHVDMYTISRAASEAITCT